MQTHQQKANQSSQMLKQVIDLKKEVDDENAALDQELAELNGESANEQIIDSASDSEPAAEPTISLPKYEPDASNDQPGTHNLNDLMLPSTADYVPPMQSTDQPANHWNTPAQPDTTAAQEFEMPAADTANTDQANSDPSDRY